MTGARIAGVGAYRPRTVVGNDAFSAPRFRVPSALVERRHAAEDETSVTMATEAGRSALEHAACAPADIDLVIGFSGMPDYEYPKDTNLLKQTLGLSNAACWTLDTACSSFISALKCAHGLILAGHHERVLLVMTMIWTRRGVDREQTDYATLGDGAAACVVERADSDGLLGVRETTDPEGFDFVTLASPFATGAAEHFEFSSDEKYRSYFVERALAPAHALLASTPSQEVTWFLGHQASQRLLLKWCAALSIPEERCLSTFPQVGNLSAVNIPMTLAHFVRDEPRVKRGDTLMFFSPGAGMHLAAMLWRY
jgi:3-oxoacyl-[acyl-carrier-protein] synthase-3